jgi:hypothetical protein
MTTNNLSAELPTTDSSITPKHTSTTQALSFLQIKNNKMPYKKQENTIIKLGRNHKREKQDKNKIKRLQFREDALQWRN